MDLIGQQASDAVASAIREFATNSDLGPGGIFVEPRAPERVLNSLIQQVDRQAPALNLRGRLEQVARSRDLELAQLFDAQLPRSNRLWELLERLEGEGGGHVVVPSRAHLTSLGPSGFAVLHRITTMRSAHIHYLATNGPSSHRQSIPVDLPAAEESVLVKSALGADAFLQRLDPVHFLVSRMWTDLLVPIEQLYKELVEDADRAAVAAGVRGFGSGGNSGYLRLLHRADGLFVVELEETRHRIDEPGHRLKALCASAVRYIDRERTITRCTLGSEYARPIEPIGAQS
ncbi:hypothetical protein IU504_13720 [Nocardia brasiliensis]|nr:hypothetical protein [Nocardia brasiliensis]